MHHFAPFICCCFSVNMNQFMVTAGATWRFLLHSVVYFFKRSFSFQGIFCLCQPERIIYTFLWSHKGNWTEILSLSQAGKLAVERGWAINVGEFAIYALIHASVIRLSAISWYMFSFDMGSGLPHTLHLPIEPSYGGFHEIVVSHARFPVSSACNKSLHFPQWYLYAVFAYSLN